MTTFAARQHQRDVADLAEARLRKMLSDRKARAERLAQDDERITAFCRRWADDHGYAVALRPEQILRAIEAEKGEGR